jgi:hypothetical protein
LLFLCIGASLASAQERDEQITVRAYNMVRISPREFTDAVHAAAGVLAPINVSVRWRVCRIEGTPREVADDPCSEPLRVDELVVRIVRAPRAFRDPDELGFSYVDADRRMGTLATVFADRVQALAARANTSSGVLLGRAIAHELGHLLIGTTDHSQDGLMQPHWAVRAGNLNRGPRWQFSVIDAVAVRSAVAARSVAASTSRRVARNGNDDSLSENRSRF